ncbi:MAG: glycine oxidase ThiO [Candidatus Omnitrophota bacterium]|nr:glycine oxidase ThiO [Candidatus Omnitrophota bacterium]
MKQTDVIVLGGGIIGCALAEELARRGQRVMVIERGAIGAEASSAAAGILSAQMDLERPGPFFELCQAARRMYPQWVQHLERRSGIPLDFQRRGILYLAMSRFEAARMNARMRWQKRHGLRVERWSAAEVGRQEPAVDGRVHAGFFFPDEAQVDNQALMRALAAACRKAGVRLMEHTAVRGVVVRDRRVRRIVTSRGVVSAPIVVNCLGSWASMGGRFAIPVEPARGQMLAFTGPKRLFRHAVMAEDAYVVQRRDGRLLVGSTVERVGFDKSLTLDGMRSILSGLCRFTSALNRCAFREAWAGFRPYSRTGRPILGPTSIEGLYVATGHFRHGILLAPITARLMADVILRGRPAFDLGPFSLRRVARNM